MTVTDIVPDWAAKADALSTDEGAMVKFIQPASEGSPQAGSVAWVKCHVQHLVFPGQDTISVIHWKYARQKSKRARSNHSAAVSMQKPTPNAASSTTMAASKAPDTPQPRQRGESRESLGSDVLHMASKRSVTDVSRFDVGSEDGMTIEMSVADKARPKDHHHHQHGRVQGPGTVMSGDEGASRFGQSVTHSQSSGGSRRHMQRLRRTLLGQQAMMQELALLKRVGASVTLGTYSLNDRHLLQGPIAVADTPHGAAVIHL